MVEDGFGAGSFRKGVPSAKEVVRQMMLCSWRTTARNLCLRLELEGWDRADAQLAIQRTIEAGHILIDDDLNLVAPNPDYVSNSPRRDRHGRPLRTIAQAMEARQGQDPQGLDRNDDSAGR